MALLSDAPRAATVRAAVATETVKIDGAAFMSLLDSRPDLRRQIESKLLSCQQSRVGGPAYRQLSGTDRNGAFRHPFGHRQLE